MYILGDQRVFFVMVSHLSTLKSVTSVFTFFYNGLQVLSSQQQCFFLLRDQAHYFMGCFNEFFNTILVNCIDVLIKFISDYQGRRGGRGGGR